MPIFFSHEQCFPSQEFKLSAGAAGGHVGCWELHNQDFDEVILVKSGTGVHTLGDQSFTIAQGDVLVISGGIDHAFTNRDDLRISQVCYDPRQLLAPRPETLRLPGYHALFVLDPTDRRYVGDSHRLHLGTSSWRMAVELSDRIAREEMGAVPGYETAMRANFMQLVVSVSRWHGQQVAGPRTGGRLHRVLEYMETHCDQPLTLDDLAARAHMSKNNFLRVFRSEQQVTPIEFLIRLRMVRACEMMHDTEKSISEIAYAVGFSDSNYFSRRFREVYGLPPSQYRKHLLKGG